MNKELCGALKQAPERNEHFIKVQKDINSIPHHMRGMNEILLAAIRLPGKDKGRCCRADGVTTKKGAALGKRQNYQEARELTIKTKGNL